MELTLSGSQGPEGLGYERDCGIGPPGPEMGKRDKRVWVQQKLKFCLEEGGREESKKGLERE